MVWTPFTTARWRGFLCRLAGLGALETRRLHKHGEGMDELSGECEAAFY